ncbi:MAG: hypothetical protein HC842_04230 [Cytophagales bacterium]|nr:hypothetical protein [Cytophagales bacterium]
MDKYNEAVAQVQYDFDELLQESKSETSDSKKGPKFTNDPRLLDNLDLARELFNEAYQAPRIENYTFGGGTNFKKEINSKITSSVSYKQSYSVSNRGSAGFTFLNEFKLKGSSELGVELEVFSPFPSILPDAEWSYEMETEMRASLRFGLSAGGLSSFTVTDKTGFQLDTTSTTGFVLSDDDDGDQFSTMVIKGAIPGHTPYFELIGGRSSCPYEEGTINRDQIYTSVVDEQGLPANNAQYNIPDLGTVFHIRIANNSFFGEDRILNISDVPAIDGHAENVRKIISGETIRPSKVLHVNVPADSSVVLPMIVERIDPYYEYDHIRLVFRPFCELSPYYGDTLTMAAYFIKPCSEVHISEPGNGWLISKDLDGDEELEERLLFKVDGYRLDERTRHLDSLVFQYRRQGTNDWFRLGSATFAQLSQYYQTYKNIYRFPTYPGIWNIGGNEAIADGHYEIRAMSDCGTKGYRLSNVISGEVDRSPLGISGFPEPLDGVFSFRDEIGLHFNDEIDHLAYQPEQVSITSSDGTLITSYFVEWKATGLSIYMDNEQAKAF